MKKHLKTVVTHTRRPTAVDVIDRILDKGIVVEYWGRVSLAGIDLLSVDARCVIASFDTYLEYAESIRKTGLLRGTDAWLRFDSPPRLPQDARPASRGGR